MKFKGTLIAVNDIEKSLKFYQDIMGEELLFDFGENKQFKSGLSLQLKESMFYIYSIKEENIKTGGNNAVLYFETENFDEFIEILKTIDNIEYVRDVIKYEWEQRSVCFYDPDRNPIEVGESMKSVITRMRKEGMSIKQISEKTQHPLDFVESICSSIAIEHV